MFNTDRHPAVAWIAALALVAATALVLDQIWTRVFIGQGDTDEAARVSHLLRPDPEEIPIFGASKARAAYVPSLIDPRAFNYGMDAASLDVVNVFLGIELAKNKQGPVIVDLVHNASETIGNLLKFVPFADRPAVADVLRRNGDLRWQYSVPGLRYFGFYDIYLKDYVSDRSVLTRVIDRGYTTALRPRPWDRGVFEAAVRKRLEMGYGYSSDPRQEGTLFQHIRSAPQRKFILVYSPLHQACFANFTGAAAFSEFVQKLRQMSNVTVLDFGRLALPDEDFEDTTHLNDRGARIFSQRMGEELRRILREP